MELAATICQRLGITPAPMVLRGVDETARFFRDQLKVDPLAWLDYLRGIDFHKPVTRETLPAGTRLIRHRSTGHARPKPFDYFALPGASPTRTGTSFPQVQFEQFKTRTPVIALVSVASTLSFGLSQKTGTFDPVSRRGGDKQLILAHNDALALEQVR